jgi:hypothetical protein
MASAHPIHSAPPSPGLLPQREILMVCGAPYSTRFIIDMARELRLSGRFQLSALGLGDPEAARSETAPDVFARRLDFPRHPPRPRSLRQNARIVRWLVGTAYRRLAAGGEAPDAADGSRLLRPLRRRVERSVERLRLQRETVPRIAGFELYHHHTLEAAGLGLLSVLPASAKIVLSIWGSDLMRSAGPSDYVDQLAACNRANLITVTSLEIREILLSKFGRHLAPKVRFALLGVTLLDEVDRCRGQRAAFLRSVGLRADGVSICVGNNASRGNQHVEVVKQLARLGPRQADRVQVIVPLGYRQPHDTYVAELQAVAEKLRVRCVFLERRLSDQEVGMLRCASDVMIHVPISDAFSAAMLESLYAGGVLVTGAWLPFSRLRAASVHFHELHRFDDLPALLGRLIDGIEGERQRATANAARIRELVHPSQTFRRWVAIYDELLAAPAAEGA